MSTKIYEAFRVKTNQLYKVLARYEEIMKPLTEDHVFTLLQAVKNPNAKGEVLSPRTMLREHVWKVIEEAHKYPYINPYDPTSGVNIWFIKSFCYIRPFSSSSIHYFNQIFSPEKIDVPSYIDYRYYNNTDKPQEISSREWAVRQDVWDNVYTAPRVVQYFFEADRDEFCLKYGSWGWPDKDEVTGEFIFDSAPERFRKWIKEKSDKFLKWRDSTNPVDLIC